LTELAEVLATRANPPEYAVKCSPPMEVGWRVSGKRLHVIALNFSDDAVKSATMDTKGGSITEGFGPYEVRVFEQPLPE
jgi:hypothetical protein